MRGWPKTSQVIYTTISWGAYTAAEIANWLVLVRFYYYQIIGKIIYRLSASYETNSRANANNRDIERYRNRNLKNWESIISNIKESLLFPQAVSVISRRTVYPIAAEATARILAHLIRFLADLTSRTLVDICKRWETIRSISWHVAESWPLRHKCRDYARFRRLRGARVRVRRWP